MKHLLITLISILLLFSFLTSCEKINGHGTETYEDGSTYVGEFKDGIYHGQGTYTLTDGNRFEGEWKDGKPWNLTIYDKNENITGKWENGNLL